MHVPLEDYTEEEIRSLVERLSKHEPPPPMLYRYRSAGEYTISEIRNHQVHVAAPESMNDPFEYNAPMRIDSEKYRRAAEQFFRTQENMTETEIQNEISNHSDHMIQLLLHRAQGIRNSCGVVCFSKKPDSNRMWGYYATSHGGICIGYDTTCHPFQLACKIRYEDPKEPLEIMKTVESDSSKFGDHLALRKGKEWEFEQEYRLPVGPMPPDLSRLLPVDPESIAEIRLGVKIKEDYREKVMAAVEDLPRKPRIFQMRCDYQNFRLLEDELDF